MPHTITTTVYQYDELDDKAKARARDWWRETTAGENDFAENVIEEAERIAGILGIELKYYSVRLMGGGTRTKPCIWWSGFSSQGDGACFEGRYSYAKGAHRTVRAEWPQDKVLHEIADNLKTVQGRYGYQLTATVTHSGYYAHKHSTTIEVAHPTREVTQDYQEEIADTLRGFMQWIYDALEAEYEYEQSDENVAELITMNEYTFRKDGRRACDV